MSKAKSYVVGMVWIREGIGFVKHTRHVPGLASGVRLSPDGYRCRLG